MREYIFERPDEAEDTAKRDANYRDELIRCKDCIWYADGFFCDNLETIYMHENDYCSMAKRKEKRGEENGK